MPENSNFGNGRGRLGRAVRSWRRTFRDETVAATKLIIAELAVDAADLADQARRDRDSRTYLAAALRLQQLIAAAERDRGRGDSGAGDDPWSRELAEIIRTGADVGDASNA